MIFNSQYDWVKKMKDERALSFQIATDSNALPKEAFLEKYLKEVELDLIFNLPTERKFTPGHRAMIAYIKGDTI